MTIAHYSSSCAYSLLHACTWAGGRKGYVVVVASISSGRRADQYRSMPLTTTGRGAKE